MTNKRSKAMKTKTQAMKTKTNGKSKERAVLVTTVHRGVFFGYAKETDGETIRLSRSRLCVHWSADVKGFMGLAANGPTSGCRVGPPAEIELWNITAVLEVTPEAAQKWEGAPWA